MNGRFNKIAGANAVERRSAACSNRMSMAARHVMAQIRRCASMEIATP
jgi:hypothetical protein